MLTRRTFLAGSTALGAVAASGCGRNDEPVVFAEGVPMSRFDKKTTAEQVVADLDLTGKTYLVTGGTSGLGLESARALLARGASTLVTGRSLDKAKDAAAGLGARCTPLALELEQPESIVACATEVARLGMPIDGLICNAGIMVLGELRQVRGIEQHFAVNHLGHFLLVNRLLPSLQQSSAARIVHVGSRSGYMQAPAAGIDFDNLRGENAHHQCESVFKAFARAVRMAAEPDERAAGTIPSTKGAL